MHCNNAHTNQAFCCEACCFALLSILLCGGLIVIPFLFSYTPDPPYLQLLDSTSVQILNLSQNQVTANWALGFSLHHSDVKTISFAHINASALQNNQCLATTSVAPFIVAPHALSDFWARFEPMTAILGNWTALGRGKEVTSMLVTLSFRMQAQANYSGLVCPRMARLKVFCKDIEMVVSPNATSTLLGLGSRTCHVKWKWLSLFKYSLCRKRLLYAVLAFALVSVVGCVGCVKLSPAVKVAHTSDQCI